MRATIDSEECISCEACVELCPEVFRMGDESSEVIVDPIPPEREECAMTAADECPVMAITIEK